MSATNAAAQLYARITDSLIAAIEDGAAAWEMPWTRLGEPPCNPAGRPYSGINHLWLSMLAGERGWDSHVWGTYRSWQAAGGQVRKGEKSTEVILMAPVESKEIGLDGNPKRFLLARTYRVFAAEQVDGSEPVVARRRAGRPQLNAPEAIAAAEDWFARLPADVRHGGDRACYQAGVDVIRLPHLAQFVNAERYYGTRAHETVHWTAHQSRLARELSGRFGSDAYAAEELVAELGAAMWCGLAGLSPVTRDDHAGYLASWLRVLRADPSHLRTVASRAQAAVSYLVGIAGQPAGRLDLEPLGAVE